MITQIKTFFAKHEWVIFVLLLLSFLLIRLPAVYSPYHQDEYKWVYYSHPEIIPPGTVPHPPLTEFIYTTLGPILGDNNFRFIPLFFGVLNLFLMFYLSKIIFDKKTALISAFLFIVSFYSLLASLMVDVDGAVMPFFLLLMFIGYYKLKLVDFRWKEASWQAITLLLFGAVCGFLVKVVFAIPIAVLALDFALEKNTFADKRKILKLILYSALGAVCLVLILILSKFIFPSFNLAYSLKYWEHFANFGSRGWFQTFIQFVKAILYSSPLLLLPLSFIDKDIFKKTRPILLFLITEVIFYLFVFDFSTGALDRYFQFIIIPLCIVSGVVWSGLQAGIFRIKKSHLVIISAISIFIFFIQFLPHYVPSLYPKSEWLNRFISLKWNFLYPFSGGSGPLGFYISFLFMALSWLVATGGIFMAFWKSQYKKLILVFLMTIGIIYNGIFIEEYLFGSINGYAPRLLHSAVEYIKNNPSISKIIVYNDNGGYDIQSIGKYQRRLYTAPYFSGQLEYLNQNKGYYFVLDVPRLDPNSFYMPYFNSCKSIYRKVDKKISATVYDCRKAPDIKK